MDLVSLLNSYLLTGFLHTFFEFHPFNFNMQYSIYILNWTTIVKTLKTILLLLIIIFELLFLRKDSQAVIELGVFYF